MLLLKVESVGRVNLSHLSIPWHYPHTKKKSYVLEKIASNGNIARNGRVKRSSYVKTANKGFSR